MATLKELIKSSGIKLRLIDYTEGNRDWGTPTQGYKLKLVYKGKSFTFPFYQGFGIAEDPKIEGVLDCLLCDASTPDVFEDFCSEFGYDTDSRKAEKTFKACLRVADKMRNLLGSEFRTFLYAERE